MNQGETGVFVSVTFLNKFTLDVALRLIRTKKQKKCSRLKKSFVFCAQKYDPLEFNCHQISFSWTSSHISYRHRPGALFLKSCSVFASDTKPLFACNIPYWYQRLNGKRADQVLSVLDKLINVSQFIIRALSSPCQVANGNINHRLPHHDPSHISAAHLASVDFSSRNTTRPKQICLEQMSNTIRLRSKHPQTWLTYRVRLFFLHSRDAGAPVLQMFSSCCISGTVSSLWQCDEPSWTKENDELLFVAWREDDVLAATKVISIHEREI